MDRSPARVSSCGLLLLVLVGAPVSAAQPRWTVGVHQLDPKDATARDYSRPGYGLSVDVSLPLTGAQGMVALLAGIEGTSLMAKQKDLRDGLTGLRVEQHTDQFHGRLFVGGRLGPHGNGTLQPYGDLALALVLYGISTTVVVPDDSDRQNDINQLLSSRTEAAFGWSAGTGVNLNLGSWGIDGGVRFLKQYGVPQQLGDGAVTIHPAYLQYRLAVSMPIRSR